MRDREKTAVMQTLELFKLIEFLVQNMPNSKHVLQKYINHNNTTNGPTVQNKTTFSQRSTDELQNHDLVDKEVDHKNDSDFDVNNTDDEENYESSGTDAESDVEMTSDTNTFTRLKRSLRKSTKTSSKTDRYPQRSRKSNKSNAENDSFFAEDSDDSDDKTFGKRKKKDSILNCYGRGKRLNRSPAKKILKESIEESDEESVETSSPVKSVRNDSISSGSQPSTSAKEVKENQKKTQIKSNESAKEPPKRGKRAAPQETGLLLIDFSQSNKVLKILIFILSVDLN
jgi:hypothetical protein